MATVAVPRLASYSLVSPTSTATGATPITVHTPITTVAAIMVPRGWGDVVVEVMLPVANASGTSLIECPTVSLIGTGSATGIDGGLVVLDVGEVTAPITGELIGLSVTLSSLANLGNRNENGETEVLIQIDMPVRDHSTETNPGTIITMPPERAISVTAGAPTALVITTATLDAAFEVTEAAIEVVLGSSARPRFDAGDTIAFNATLFHSVNVSTAAAHNIVLTLVVDSWLLIDAYSIECSPVTCAASEVHGTSATVTITELDINATVTVRWVAFALEDVPADLRPSYSAMGTFSTLARSRGRARRAGCSTLGRVITIDTVYGEVDSNAAIPLMDVAIRSSTLPVNRTGQHYLVPGEELTLAVSTRIPEVGGDYNIVISVAPMRLLSAYVESTSGIMNGDNLYNVNGEQTYSSQTFAVGEVLVAETTADATTYGTIDIIIIVVLEDNAEASAVSRELGSVLYVTTSIGPVRFGDYEDSDLGYGPESDANYSLAVQEPVLTITHDWQDTAPRIVEALDTFEHETIVRHSQASSMPNLAYDLSVLIEIDAIYDVDLTSVMGCLYERSSPAAGLADDDSCAAAGGVVVLQSGGLDIFEPPPPASAGTAIRFAVSDLRHDVIFHVVAQSVVVQDIISGSSQQATAATVTYTSIPSPSLERGREYYAAQSFETAVKSPAIAIQAATLELDAIVGLIRIGEIFVIRTAVIFAGGSTTAVEVELELPPGLQFVSATVTAVEQSFTMGVPDAGNVVSLDAPLITRNRTVFTDTIGVEIGGGGEEGNDGDLGGPGVLNPEDPTLGETTLDFSFEVVVGGGGTSDVTRVRYSAPEVVNVASVPGLNGSADDSVIIDTVVFVRDVEGNTGTAPQTVLLGTNVTTGSPQTMLVSNATIGFGELGQTVRSSDTVTLGEPELTLLITHTTVAPVDGDDVVDYTLTISHTASSTASAFEFVMEVSLEEHFVTDNAVISALTATLCTVTNVTAAGFWVECLEIADSEAAAVVIEFSARVLGAVAANATASVSASSIYTSMPYSSLSQGSYTGRTKYANTNSPPITTAVPVITIEPQETSRDDTEGWWLGIAELVTYRIAIVLPEVTTNLTVTLDLPAELECRAITVNLVGSSLITPFTATGDELDCNAASLTFNFGVIENVPDNVARGLANMMTFDLVSQLVDVPTATDGRSLMVLAGYTCHDDPDAGLTAQNEDTNSQVVVTEPLLALSAVATTAGPYDADDIINFTITLGYMLTSHATAHDVSFGAVLGTGVDEIVDVHPVQGSVLAFVMTDHRTLNWSTPMLEAGAFFGIIVSSRVQQSVYPGMTLGVFAETAFDSHPAPTELESQLSPTTFEGRGYELETASPRTLIAVAQPSIEVTRSASSSLNATVGELIELRVAVRLPEATISDTALTLNLTGIEQHGMVELLSAEVVHIGEAIQCTHAEALFVHSAGVADWNSSARLNLGECVNVADNLGDGNDTILVDAVVRLKDVAVVAGGGTFAIRSELGYTVPPSGAAIATDDTIAMSVVEPKMGIEVLTVHALRALDAADLVNFTLQVEHTLASRSTASTAYDIAITAVLAPELEFLEDTTDWPGLLGVDSATRHSLAENNGIVSVYVASHPFSPTRTYPISFVAKLRSGVSAEAFDVRCTASVEWNSLPAAVRIATGQAGRSGVDEDVGGLINVAGLSIDSKVMDTSLAATAAAHTIAIGEVARVAATIMQPEVDSTVRVTATLVTTDTPGFEITSYDLEIGSNIQGCHGGSPTLSADGLTLSLVLVGTCSNIGTRDASASLDNATDAIVLTLAVLARNVTTLVQDGSCRVDFLATVTEGPREKPLTSSTTLAVVEPAFAVETRMPAAGYHFSPGAVIFLDLLVNVSTFGYAVNITVALPHTLTPLNVSFGSLTPGNFLDFVGGNIADELRFSYPVLRATEAVAIRMAVELDPNAVPGLSIDVGVMLVHASSPVGAPEVRRGVVTTSFPTLYVTHLECTFADTTSESASTGTDFIIGESITYTADCLVRGKGPFMVTVPLMRADGTSLGCFELAEVTGQGSNVELNSTLRPIVSPGQVLIPINLINLATDPATPEPIGDRVRFELTLRGVDANASECSADAALPAIRSRGFVANTGIDIDFGGHMVSAPDVLVAVAPLLELAEFNCSRTSIMGGDVISYTATIVAANTSFTSAALDVMINTSSPYIDDLAITSGSHVFSSVTYGRSRNHLVDATTGAGISAVVARIFPGDTMELAWTGTVSNFVPHGQSLNEELALSFQTVSDPVFRYLAFDQRVVINTPIHELVVQGEVLPGATAVATSALPLFGIGEETVFRITLAVPSGRSADLALVVNFDDSLLNAVPLAANVGLNTNFSDGHTTTFQASSIEVQLGTVQVATGQDTATYYFDVPFVIASASAYNLLNNVTVGLVRDGDPVSAVGDIILFRVSEPFLVTNTTTYVSANQTVDAGDTVRVTHLICNLVARAEMADGPSTIAYAIQPSFYSSVPLQSEAMTCACIGCNSTHWYAPDNNCDSVRRLLPGECLIFTYTVQLNATMELGPAVDLRVPIVYQSVPSANLSRVYDPVVGAVSIPSTPVNIDADDGVQTAVSIGEMAVVAFTLVFPEGVVDNALLQIDLGPSFVFPEFDDDSTVDVVGGARVRRKDDTSPIALSANGTSTPVYDLGASVTSDGMHVGRASNRKITVNVSVVVAANNQLASPADASMSLRFIVLVVGDADTTAANIDLRIATRAAQLGAGRLAMTVLRPQLAPMVGTLTREVDGALSYVGAAAHVSASTLGATDVSYSLSLAPEMADSSLLLSAYNLTVTEDFGNGTLSLPVGSSASLGVELMMLDPASLAGGDAVCLSVQLSYGGPTPAFLFLAAIARIDLPETRLIDAPAQTCITIEDSTDAATAESGGLAAGSVAGIIIGVLLAGTLVALLIVAKRRQRVVHAKEDAESAEAVERVDLDAEFEPLYLEPKLEPLYLVPTDLGMLLDGYINKERPLCSLIESGNEGWVRYRRAIGFDHGYYGNKLNRLQNEHLEDVYAVLPLPVPQRAHQLKLHVLGDEFIGMKLPVSDEAGVVSDAQAQERALADVTLFMLDSMPDVLVERALDVITNMVMWHSAKRQESTSQGAATGDVELTYATVEESLYAVVALPGDDEDLYAMLDSYDPKSNPFFSTQSNGDRCLNPNAAKRHAISASGGVAVAIYPTALTTESKEVWTGSDRLYDIGGSVQLRGENGKRPAFEATYSFAAPPSTPMRRPYSLGGGLPPEPSDLDIYTVADRRQSSDYGVATAPDAADGIYDSLSFIAEGPRNTLYGAADGFEGGGMYGAASGSENAYLVPSRHPSEGGHPLAGTAGATYTLAEGESCGGGTDADGVDPAATHDRPANATYELGGDEGGTYDLAGQLEVNPTAYLGASHMDSHQRPMTQFVEPHPIEQTYSFASFTMPGELPGDTDADANAGIAVPATYELGGAREPATYELGGAIDGGETIDPDMYNTEGYNSSQPAESDSPRPSLSERKLSIMSFSEMDRLMSSPIGSRAHREQAISGSRGGAGMVLEMDLDNADGMDDADDGGYIESQGVASTAMKLLGFAGDVVDNNDNDTDDTDDSDDGAVIVKEGPRPSSSSLDQRSVTSSSQGSGRSRRISLV